ncbi:MAG: diphosphomevalonate decarboxylase [Bacteriovoracaceae bacterium]|nr:diphosphomevalonate decarboxylase [Bacteriovoracaceae bacterium]
MVSESGISSWKSPSNIAIVKYWGKHGIQLPKNPSISFTLNECTTSTQISWVKGSGKLEFVFEGKSNSTFYGKIEKYLSLLQDEMPFLVKYDLTIESSNSFPHSAGIASSASSMSALALCLVSMEEKIVGKCKDFFRRSNFLARLGSGSACRSLYGGATSWGISDLSGSSDEYAIPVDIHPIFETFHDAVVIVDAGEKSVSSRAGHNLMNGHLFASVRYDQAHANLKRTHKALVDGDIEQFGNVLEEEALTLHAMMMTSNPSYLLMRPNTISVIEKIRSFRNKTGTPIFFTLDAGPNIHILYPDSVKDTVKTFIENDLCAFAAEGRVIYDRIGKGPQKIR